MIEIYKHIYGQGFVDNGSAHTMGVVIDWFIMGNLKIRGDRSGTLILYVNNKALSYYSKYDEESDFNDFKKDLNITLRKYKINQIIDK